MCVPLDRGKSGKTPPPEPRVLTFTKNGKELVLLTGKVAPFPLERADCIRDSSRSIASNRRWGVERFYHLFKLGVKRIRDWGTTVTLLLCIKKKLGADLVNSNDNMRKELRRHPKRSRRKHRESSPSPWI